MHRPASENCGGVVEPLAKGIPVVASRVGGLPEVVIDGVTGLLISANDPLAAARAAMETLDRPREAQEMAMRGKRLVEVMFDIERVTEEVHEIYRYILGDRERPPRIFDSREHLGELVDQSYESFP
jgi:glycosyltransferase involved in cell wall biosynthesis